MYHYHEGWQGNGIYVFVCLSVILYTIITVILPLPPCFKSLKMVISDVLPKDRILFASQSHLSSRHSTFILSATCICEIFHGRRRRGQIGTPDKGPGPWMQKIMSLYCLVAQSAWSHFSLLLSSCIFPWKIMDRQESVNPFLFFKIATS